MARPRVSDSQLDKLDYFVEQHTDVPNPRSLSVDEKLKMLLKAHESEIGEYLGPGMNAR